MSSFGAESTEIYTWVVYSVMCQILELFGVLTNIINIICFARQGFKDPINISLLGLTISDLGCLITLVCTNIFMTPAVVVADLSFEVTEVAYLIFGPPHYTFSRISCWITAVIVIERCLCIVAPLQVRTIVTRKRVAAVVVCIFIVLIFTGSPMFVVNKLGMKFSYFRNKTLLGLVPAPDREQVEKVSFTINNFVIPFAAFFVIIICTVILIINLRKGMEWRKKSVSSVTDDVLYRNQKVAKMVVMISALFISCFVPFSTIMLVIGFEPELGVGGEHFHISVVIYGIVLLLESVNSSFNIFIYYNISSNYRRTFQAIFCTCRTQEYLR